GRVPGRGLCPDAAPERVWATGAPIGIGFGACATAASAHPSTARRAMARTFRATEERGSPACPTRNPLETARCRARLVRSTLYDMRAAVTIRLDPRLERLLGRVCKQTGRSRWEIV